MADSGLDWANLDRERVGVYIGVTEHGNVETENEIYEIKGYDYDTSRLVAPPQPAHRGQQPGRRDHAQHGHHRPALHDRRRLRRRQRRLDPGRPDAAARRVRRGASAGGVSESIRTFGIFAGFASQGALATHEDPTKASRPFDQRPQRHRRGRGRLHVHPRATSTTPATGREDLRRAGRLRDEQRRQRLRAAQSRRSRPAACSMALRRARLNAGRHRHGEHPRHGHHQRRHAGVHRPAASVFQRRPAGRSTTRRASSATPWGRPARWNWPAICRRSTTASATRRSTSTGSTPSASLPGLVLNEPRERKNTRYILNNSFGMLGINSVVIIGKVYDLGASCSAVHHRVALRLPACARLTVTRRTPA